MLRAHRPGDPRESLSVSIMAAELERLDRPFDQEADLTHVTASAIVVGDRGIVLHRHRRLHRWLQPGGHLEPGESPAEAVDPGMRRGDRPGGDPSAGRTDADPRGRTPGGPGSCAPGPSLSAVGARPPIRPPGPGRARRWPGSPGRRRQALADDALAGALRSARRLIGSSPEWRVANRSDQRSGSAERWPSRSTR